MPLMWVRVPPLAQVAGLAQWSEQLHCKQRAVGSNPTPGSIFRVSITGNAHDTSWYVGSNPAHGPGSASRKRGNHIVLVRYGGQHEQVKAAVGGRSYSGVIEPSPRTGSVGRASEQTWVDAPSVKAGRKGTERTDHFESPSSVLKRVGFLIHAGGKLWCPCLTVRRNLAAWFESASNPVRLRGRKVQ